MKIQERMLHARDTMEIEDRDGNRVATVKKALITPLRERWTVTVADGPDLEVKGNIVDHEYTIEDGRTKAAEVSKSWFRVADTYGVEVAPGQDPVVILAVTAVLDHHGPPGALIAGVGPGRSAVTGPGDRRWPAWPPASGEAAGPLRASGERECRSPKASGGPYGIDARAYEVGLL